MRESKECLECGGIYFKGETEARSVWEARKYCSVRCFGEVQKRRASERAEVPVGLEAEDPVGLALVKVLAPEVEAVREPIKRKLKIVRVAPNKRHLVCEYYELAQRRVCTVLVKGRNDKYVRGMEFELEEPREELAFQRPWYYGGRPPRWRGRW